MQSEELKPCPFCGGQAERVDIEDGDNSGGSFVHCTVCDASGNIEFEFKENFISNWNRRAALSAAEPQPAPSVAVKALQMADETFRDLGWHDKYEATTAALAALSAQVQDESEIVDCLSAGKPFVFDPATNFCHADDGGAPEHGIKYGPTAQVQDVAGWKLVPIEPTEEMKKAGREEAEDCEDVYGSAIYSTAEIYRAMLPAAPAKQEG
ncbi:Lar family restriction alleviation protein [Agrobacterium pusense]|uniref:Lar family restriction alleviation protein n=1 Tax=Agrobacterium pusense TaxID=648995 RepID=UPI0009F966DD|nr:Lar family restriction alleviation protein [Agrobacterium pusense]